MTKILIIEDETPLRLEIMEWLTFEGYEAFGAPDGIEGVSEAIHRHPDLILCDMIMPGLDGQGVLLALRANPAVADTPFIFTTARTAYGEIREGIDAGADDYVTKPFTNNELLKVIKTCLEKKAE